LRAKKEDAGGVHERDEQAVRAIHVRGDPAAGDELGDPASQRGGGAVEPAFVEEIVVPGPAAAPVVFGQAGEIDDLAVEPDIAPEEARRGVRDTEWGRGVIVEWGVFR
jgi:hypothetical protein